MKLEGKTALVTGGASGLGEATARRLHDGGTNIVICDVSEEKGAQVASDLGRGAIFMKTDVTSEEAVSGAIAEAQEQFGGLHIAVSCAGIAIAEKVVGREAPHDLGRFRRVVEVNLIGTFNVLRLAAAEMVNNDPGDDGERGVVINTASVAAYEGQIGQTAYSASKGGIVGLTVPAARDLARSGIRVCAIAPGVFDTPLMAGLPEKAKVALEQMVPFPSRLGKPEEYAALAQHIIENRMLNGETIRLDGALRMPPR